MRIEVWSDVICPWCYLGQRRFDRALATFPHRDEVEVVWRSYELDPRAPRQRTAPYAELLARKYGLTHDQAAGALARMEALAAADGLELHLDRTRSGNTFDAHRLLHLARDRGLQAPVHERLFRAYFTEAEPIGEPAVLARLATEAGLDPEEVGGVLDGGAYAGDVRAEEAEAVELGCTGVPFFVIDRRVAVPGAQDVDRFRKVLDRAWATRAEASAPTPGETGTSH